MSMERLRQYLDDHSISQVAFAKKIGVEQPTVSDWLNGVMKPKADKLIAISRATGISIDDLLATGTAGNH